MKSQVIFQANTFSFELGPRIMGEGDDCKMKSAMLIGDPALGAFQRSGRINVGVLYIDPGAEYPEHCHYAEEIYQVVSGRGFWFHGSKGETEVLKPGEKCLTEFRLLSSEKYPAKNCKLAIRISLFCRQ